MLDGDHMGRWLRGDLPAPAREMTRQRHADISTALSRFAIKIVPPLIEESRGQLIYAGGDDVLAMLPTETALACARALSTSFRGALFDAGTASAGLVVAHYKEDLRFVLDRARGAEKEAKARGRDALVLTIIRRSGEETTALLPWCLAAPFQELVGRFRGEGDRPGASDRWAYRLRGDLPTLRGLHDRNAVDCLVRQAISRIEDPMDRDFLEGWAGAFLDAYRAALGERSDALAEANAIAGFITLCQSASFLARGRDAR
jgi:CRISPR-associated protein Cmr2